MATSSPSQSRRANNTDTSRLRQPVVTSEEGRLTEGYANMFVDDVTEYQCTFCLSVARDPKLLIGCGHSFCGACIDRWITSSGKTPKCPIDKVEFDVSTAVPDKRLARVIGGLKVYCDHKDRGCGVTIELRDLQVHLESCDYRISDGDDSWTKRAIDALQSTCSKLKADTITLQEQSTKQDETIAQLRDENSQLKERVIKQASTVGTQVRAIKDFKTESKELTTKVMSHEETMAELILEVKDLKQEAGYETNKRLMTEVAMLNDVSNKQASTISAYGKAIKDLKKENKELGEKVAGKIQLVDRLAKETASMNDRFSKMGSSQWKTINELKKDTKLLKKNGSSSDISRDSTGSQELGDIITVQDDAIKQLKLDTEMLKERTAVHGSKIGTCAAMSKEVKTENKELKESLVAMEERFGELANECKELKEQIASEAEMSRQLIMLQGSSIGSQGVAIREMALERAGIKEMVASQEVVVGSLVAEIDQLKERATKHGTMIGYHGTSIKGLKAEVEKMGQLSWEPGDADWAQELLSMPMEGDGIQFGNGIQFRDPQDLTVPNLENSHSIWAAKEDIPVAEGKPPEATARVTKTWSDMLQIRSATNENDSLPSKSETTTTAESKRIDSKARRWKPSKQEKLKEKSAMSDVALLDLKRGSTNRSPCKWKVEIWRGMGVKESPTFYTEKGYRMGLEVVWKDASDNRFTVGCNLMRGDDDGTLRWPWKGDERLLVADVESGTSMGDCRVVGVGDTGRKRPTSQRNCYYLYHAEFDCDRDKMTLELTVKTKSCVYLDELIHNS